MLGDRSIQVRPKARLSYSPASLASTLNSLSGPSRGDVRPLPAARTLDALDFEGLPSSMVTGKGEPTM